VDKTQLTNAVANLFRLAGHKVDTSVEINFSEIDVVAEELQGLVRKKILVECTEDKVVGIKKMRDDQQKLQVAIAHLGARAIPMHVALYGYSKNAKGFAVEHGIDTYTLEELTGRLVNFDSYIEAVEKDPARTVILDEYQPTTIHYEGKPEEKTPALELFETWLSSRNGTSPRWLTVLGDYGVGKSWTLKRLLFDLLDKYKADPNNTLLPFFVPLQRFTKAFDFRNLILATLAMYNLSGVHLSAFEYLAQSGRIVFLYDSFDEMAQSLSRVTIRENFRQLVDGIGKSRAIMTSRPTYFEGKAERFLVIEGYGASKVHRLDEMEYEKHTALARFTQQLISKHQFARLNDLTPTQRRQLFAKVLKDKPDAKQRLDGLFARFQELENITQRAVIARLLTTVAETLATSTTVLTPDGYPLLPEDLATLNQAKIFEIVVHNLLQRDMGFGDLTAGDRLHFLRRFSVFLQHPDRDSFAEPDDIRGLVGLIFSKKLQGTDQPQQMVDNYYRACRRHSGLTTEGQFRDTSGQIDMPVDELDADSRVGFSHNSLREYLVADSLAEFVLGGDTYADLETVVVSEAVGDFFREIAEYRTDLSNKLANEHQSGRFGRMKEKVFRLVYFFLLHDSSWISLLGSPAVFSDLDLSALSLRSLNLYGSSFKTCVLDDTDFRETDLREATFRDCIIRGAMFDKCKLDRADFTASELQSVYVYDEFNTETAAILQDKEARQWLFSHGARVWPDADLNPFLGKKWYEAAREVCKTLQKEIAGTRKLEGLWKGTPAKHRALAKDFAEYLLRKGLLTMVRKSSKGGGIIVTVEPNARSIITAFGNEGKKHPVLGEFFRKHDTTD
jgi:hypothetical protein